MPLAIEKMVRVQFFPAPQLAYLSLIIISPVRIGARIQEEFPAAPPPAVGAPPRGTGGGTRAPVPGSPPARILSLAEPHCSPPSAGPAASLLFPALRPMVPLAPGAASPASRAAGGTPHPKRLATTTPIRYSSQGRADLQPARLPLSSAASGARGFSLWWRRECQAVASTRHRTRYPSWPASPGPTQQQRPGILRQIP
jgi:hypothetical protein